MKRLLLCGLYCPRNTREKDKIRAWALDYYGCYQKRTPTASGDLLLRSMRVCGRPAVPKQHIILNCSSFLHFELSFFYAPRMEICESGRAASCFLNGTRPFCKQKGPLPPPAPPATWSVYKNYNCSPVAPLHRGRAVIRRKTLSRAHLRSTGPSDAPHRQAAQATDKRCLLRFA